MGTKSYGSKYKLSVYGSDYKLSDHFTLGEFACNDGSDIVYVGKALVQYLEKLRDYLGDTCRISVTSGYRTSTYNSKIGGATGSWHCYGWAADVKVTVDGKALAPKYVCCIAQLLGFNGIGAMKTSTHLDMRTYGCYRGDEYKGGAKTYSNNVNGDFFSYYGISKAEVTAMKAEEKEAVAENATTTEDDDMVYYKTIDDVPTWYKDSVQKLIDKGVLNGTGNGEINVSEDLCRTLTILDRAEVFDK